MTQAWSRRAGLASGGGHKRVLTHLSDLTLAWKCRQFETLPQTLSSAGDGPNWPSRRRVAPALRACRLCGLPPGSMGFDHANRGDCDYDRHNEIRQKVPWRVGHVPDAKTEIADQCRAEQHDQRVDPKIDAVMSQLDLRVRRNFVTSRMGTINRDHGGQPLFRGSWLRYGPGATAC